VFGAVAVLLLGRAALAAPKLTWSPDTLVETIETGKDTTLSVAFTLSKNVGTLDVDVEVAPELQDYVSVAPASFTGIMGGETHTIAVTIAAPLGFPLGVFTGTVKLRDAAGGGGGVSAQPLDLTLTIVDDVTLPVVTIEAPETGSAFAAGPIAVSGSLDDPFATLALNGQVVPVSGGQWSATVALEEGNNVITAVATDQVGNIGTATIEAVLDTRAPVVTIDSPPDGFVTNEAIIDVAGMINDIVVGTVSGDGATVTVNGIVAEVDNRGYLAQGVPLQPGPNTITALGEDAAGNLASAAITVSFDAMVGEPQIRLVSGNNQTGAIAAELTAPLVVALEDALGVPVAGVTVIFKVIENNGTLSGGGRSGVASVAVVTDALGQASAPWTLGTRAGAGNNLVEAMAVGFAGSVLFTASALPAAPDKINADAGNNQSGATGQPLALPFVAVVTDAGHNRLAGVPVTFSVVQGDGTFNGLANLTVDTDGSGRAVALLTLGPEEGFDNNVVEADFAGLVGLPASFVASGKAPGDPVATSVSGVVLDNSDVPVPGVTLSIEGTALSAQSDAEGQFTIPGVAPGPLLLLADGGTTTRPGVWPALEFELVAVAGQDNRLERPVYLLPLDEANQLCVDGATGGTLTLPEVPGFALTVEPGAATFLDGSQAGCVSVTLVHADKVPMTPNFGQQPRFVVTIQPVGVLFDPPAALTLPNTDGLAPGAVTELYSFDHDLGQFVAIGTGTVSPDGTVVESDPGVGVIKAGWHCGGDPQQTGVCEPVHVAFTSVPTTIFLPPGNDETITADGGPSPGSFSWESSDSSVLSVTASATGATTSTPVAAGTADVIVTYTAQSEAFDTATAQVTVIPVAMKLEIEGDTVISDDGNFSEDTTVRVTAVNADTGETLTSFTGDVLIAEQSEIPIYSQNGGTLPSSVPITAGGTTTFVAKSLAGPNDDGGNQGPDPAQVITTNFPVY
jgi:hypothetical protein